MAHEIGHTFGLGNCYPVPGNLSWERRRLVTGVPMANRLVVFWGRPPVTMRSQAIWRIFGANTDARADTNTGMSDRVL